MADAMCGPSNPLQQFTKQSNHDRTLQQDRLTSRHSPAQGFRSADPNAGHLDPEFEAFQAGLSPSDLPLHHPVPFQQPAFAGVSPGPLWANDFQRLEISPQPHMQHQRALRPNQVPSSWAQGFQQNIAQEAPRAQSSSPSPLVFQQRARYGLSGFQSNFTQPSYAPAEQSIKGKEPVYEEFDQAAFDLAFDQAQNDIVTETEQQDTSMDDIMKAMDESKHADLGAGVRGDIMHDNEPRTIQEAVQQPIDQHPDDDALAATAHELLEKVEHNRSDKFKNSQFLGLMRKLRDREVKVEGDKMVSTVSLTALASSPADSTYGSGTASPAPLAAETSQVHILSSASAITPRPDSGINVASASPTNATLNDTSLPRFDNSEQRPFPLDGGIGRPAGIVDTRPPDYGIPAYEQDVDGGRDRPVQLEDGQDVVDLLDESGPLSDEIGTSAAPTSLRPGVPPFYADVRPTGSTTGMAEMLYGATGTLSQSVPARR